MLVVDLLKKKPDIDDLKPYIEAKFSLKSQDI